MSDYASAAATLGIVNGVVSFVYVACDVAAIVVAATVVRRHRPDAWQGLLVWGILSLALAVVAPIVSVIGAAVVGRGGIEAMLHFQMGWSLLSCLLHVTVFAVLVRALVKLAQPPKPVTTEPVGPYR